EEFAPGDDAQGGPAARKRNQPEPHVRLGRMHGDQDLVAIQLLVEVILDVREDRMPHRESRRPLETEEPRERAPEAARIEDEARLDLRDCPIRRARSEAGAAAPAFGRDDLRLETDLDPLARRLPREKRIEFRAFDLIGRRAPGRRALTESELPVLLAARKRRAVLVLEAGRLDGPDHAGLRHEIEAMREQALSDRETRKALPLEHQHVASAALQERRGDRPRWPRADDDDLTALAHDSFLTSPPARTDRN